MKQRIPHFVMRSNEYNKLYVFVWLCIVLFIAVLTLTQLSLQINLYVMLLLLIAYIGFHVFTNKTYVTQKLIYKQENFYLDDRKILITDYFTSSFVIIICFKYSGNFLIFNTMFFNINLSKLGVLEYKKLIAYLRFAEFG